MKFYFDHLLSVIDGSESRLFGAHCMSIINTAPIHTETAFTNDVKIDYPSPIIYFQLLTDRCPWLPRKTSLHLQKYTKGFYFSDNSFYDTKINKKNFSDNCLRGYLKQNN
jgi:hypothetical protein